MKIASFRRSITAAGWVLLCAAAAAPAWSAERGPLRRAPDVQPAETEARVIVKFKADSSMARAFAANPNATQPMQAQMLSSRLGLQLSDGHALGARTQVLTAKGIGSRELAARLAAQSDVEYAEVDERMRAFAAPNDPLYRAALTTSPASGQWYLQAPNTTLVSAVNAEAAWAITTGRSSVVVAVLDTGVRKDHPDLAGKLLPGYDFITNPLNANDGGGRDSDPSDPGDWVTAADVPVNGVGGVPGCTTADIGDSIWHGTQTAGLIGAATNNGVGMASIGRDVMVLPVRVLGKCGGLSSDIQQAMLWAAGLPVAGVPSNPNPAKVINLSLGSASTTCSQSYQDAVNSVLAAGVVVVAAAGNEGLAVGTPANCTGVIGVAGLRHSGTKVGYSNLGDKASISAPAGNCFNSSGACLYPLLTTSNAGTQGPGANIYTNGDGPSEPTLGTSFSAPLVAGTAALMLSANPSLTPAQVLAALKSTARAFPSTGAAPIQRIPGGPFVPVTQCTSPSGSAPQDYECYCNSATCGAGLLDAGAAVAAVAVVTANISVASTTVTAGDAVALDGTQSRASGSASIDTYLWDVISGNATFTSAKNASSATLATSAAGTVVVSLTVTDSAGRQASTSTTLTVNASPGTPVTPAPSSGGGGGGALNLEWLWTLVASTLALHLASRRQRRLAKAPR
ncbi:MAG: S8 family serine peptidase [Burkholderiales bacterium]